MDLSKAIAELKSERDAIDQAIAVLSRLAGGGKPRRGRPPKWLSEGKETSGRKAAKRVEDNGQRGIAAAGA